jgi:hypothetical protein
MTNSNKPIFRKDQTGIEKTNPIPGIEPKNKSPLNDSSPVDQTISESNLTNFLIIKLLISCVDLLNKTGSQSKKIAQSPEPLLVPLL